MNLFRVDYYVSAPRVLRGEDTASYSARASAAEYACLLGAAIVALYPDCAVCVQVSAAAHDRLEIAGGASEIHARVAQIAEAVWQTRAWRVTV